MPDEGQAQRAIALLNAAAVDGHMISVTRAYQQGQARGRRR